LLVVGVIGISYERLFGLRDPEWTVKLSDDAAFTLAATILMRAGIEGCGDLEVRNQYPRFFEIEVLCNGSRSHSIEYKPSFAVDGKHVQFTWLDKAYCVKLPNGEWENAYLDFDKAGKSALELSNSLQAPTKIYAANNYDVGETQMNEEGVWELSSYIESATNDNRQGCELTELE